MDFAKFFARRELVAKGLVKFSDRAENYRAWRSSFLNAIRGLELSCSQELDLLVKWLGNESAEHARRIRDINVNYPDIGLKMVWERIDECYGSPEAIESALFKRMEDFPKITSKGNQRLRDLADLLLELLVAKIEGDLLGLAFLDTGRGVNPIVEKLPYNLQEMWIKHGSRYKQTHNVPFPPFRVFVDFVIQQAKIRNDPSFDFTLSCVASPGVKSHKAPVIVHKTNISSTGSSYRSTISSQADDILKDLNKQCPLHKKPHPFLKCRAFREKPMEDRKAFLKENNICFKCCSTMSHFAKDCKVSVKCTECNSTEDNTALHPGPPTWTLAQAHEHGGEQMSNDSNTPAVISQCTEVCKGLIESRSCSKICLVKVYPMGNHEKAIKVYAILDDQSNKSLAKSIFFDAFNIKGPSSPYSLKTCAGTVETAGRKATGYQIESIDGQTRLSLPTILECNQIPDNRSEIPTSDIAVYHPHLKRIAHLIPKLDPEAQILLLLGRDILQVHKARGHN
ncbi:zinc finger [Pristimantis euphronides]